MEDSDIHHLGAVVNSDESIPKASNKGVGSSTLYLQNSIFDELYDQGNVVSESNEAIELSTPFDPPIKSF